MGNLTGAGIGEIREYIDPSNPEKGYFVVLPITVLEAVKDISSGKTLKQILTENAETIKGLKATDIGALTEIKIGTVTTGAAGSKASASATTKDGISTLNLTIPKGDTGATGAQGAKGATGAAGATGTRGSRWSTGTAITGTSTTATVFSGTGITDALVNDMYLNTSTGYVYRCTVAGAAAAAKWVYAGSIKGVTGTQGAKGDTGAAGATGATGAKGDKGDSGVNYGTCATTAATAAKTVSLTGFTLTTGAAVIVKFTVANTAANPTLNVNSTGAKDIRYRNATIAAGYLAANRTYEFVYDGTYWQLVGDLDTTYSNASASVGGLVSTGAQTFAGDKTFNGQVIPNGATALGTAQARKIACGTAAATTSNCPAGALYCQYE